MARVANVPGDFLIVADVMRVYARNMITTACACSKIRRASRVLTRLYDDALAPVGLTAPQFALLRTLQRLGTVSVTELAEATGHERSAMGRNLKLLADAGLVTPAPGRDARCRSVELCAEGAAAIARAEPYWIAAQAKVDAALGPEARATLFAILDKVEALCPVEESSA